MKILLIFLAMLAVLSLGQIINPLTGREYGIDQLVQKRSRMNLLQERNRRFHNRMKLQDRSDNHHESEYLLSDGTPIYKFFKRNPYGKK